jgi:hypothetical protein
MMAHARSRVHGSTSHSGIGPLWATNFRLIAQRPPRWAQHHGYDGPRWWTGRHGGRR